MDKKGEAKEAEEKKIMFFSEDDYREGDTITKKNLAGEVENQLTKQINQFIQKAITFILGTVLGTLLILVWNINGEVRELKGTNSSPDVIIQSISQRVEKLEDTNKALIEKNNKLEIDKMKLEFELINLKKEKK